MDHALSEEDKLIWPNLPSVSVTVLNYNAYEHLEACFSSLQELIYPDDKLELILVDNASTDQSLAFIQANFADVKIISNDQNYGFSQGNNIGAEKVASELVAFLNPDMRVDQRWLIELVKPLLIDTEVAAVGSKILTWDGKQIDFAGSAANFYGYGYQVGRGQDATANFNQFKPILFACGGAILIRRQLFLEVGGFDEDFFAYYEDLDLGWRLWVLGYKVVFAPASITYHIHHGSWEKVSTEKRRVLYERNAFFTILKNYDETNLNKILPAALLLLLKRIYLAAGIDDDFFRLGPKPQVVEPRSTSSESQVRNEGVFYGPSYYLKETWQSLTNEGLYGLFLKFRAELKRRHLARLQAQPPGKMELDQKVPHKATIPTQALSYVVAGNDIITLYEKMLHKREFIQARRRRSDKEVMELFGNPFGSSELWPEYTRTQKYLTFLFRIDKIFED